MWFHMVHHTAKKLSGAHVSTSPFLSCEDQWHSIGLAWGSTASEMSSSDTSMTFLPRSASSITDFMVSVYHISQHPLHTAVLQQPTGYHLTGQIHSHVINKGQENVLIVKQKRKLISIILSNSTKEEGPKQWSSFWASAWRLSMSLSTFSLKGICDGCKTSSKIHVEM